jgi:hypothetical protein
LCSRVPINLHFFGSEHADVNRHLTGESVFFTGSAGERHFALASPKVAPLTDVIACPFAPYTPPGTGKSVLLREIIKLRKGSPSPATSATDEDGESATAENPPRLAVTASTGIASVNIGGTTLHSWAGVGLGQESVKQLAGKIRYQKLLYKVLQRWLTVETLVIDESKRLGFESRNVQSLTAH